MIISAHRSRSLGMTARPGQTHRHAGCCPSTERWAPADIPLLEVQPAQLKLQSVLITPAANASVATVISPFQRNGRCARCAAQTASA